MNGCRLLRHALALAAILSAATLSAGAQSAPTERPPASPAPAASASPAPCNAPPTLVHAVEPVAPALAKQEGIGGTVEVAVELDVQSTIVSAKIRSSPSAILNRNALDAARASTYRTRLVDCAPVPSVYVFTASFPKP